MTSPTPSVPRIFVSYSRKDTEFTQRLVSDLHSAGAEVWVDVEGIRHGNFIRIIDEAIAQCEWMVLVLTPDAIASEYVREETFIALHRARQGFMRAVIPVMAVPCAPGTIPPSWDVLQRYDATRGYATAVAGVLAAIGLVPPPNPDLPVIHDATAKGAARMPAPARDQRAFDLSRVELRRLPVYLLLDCSGSMAGAKIEWVSQGVQLLYQELMRDPVSAHTVHITMITFASTAAYQMDLVPLAAFTSPALQAGGSTSLGAALSLLNHSLDIDPIPNSPKRRGDFEPLVFLLTDGHPTDVWQAEAQKLRNRTKNKPGTIVALAIGLDADVLTLKQIATTILWMKDVTGGNLRAFFEWVSESVRDTSGADDSQVYMPPLPLGITVET